MSKLVISDLSFFTELEDQELKVAGGASAGGAAAANYSDAVATVGSTTDGDVYSNANGSYSSYYSDGSYYSSYYSGPSANTSTSGRYYYY
jgi:hypothetical protein